MVDSIVPFLFIERHDRFISIRYVFDISALSAISIRRLIDVAVTISVTLSFYYVFACLFSENLFNYIAHV